MEGAQVYEQLLLLLCMTLTISCSNIQLAIELMVKMRMLCNEDFVLGFSLHTTILKVT